jgi:cytidine deaminase
VNAAPPPKPAVDWAALRTAAAEAAQRAYAPYSNFRVGAAGLTDDGRIVVGCNVENASYGLTLCAECGLVSAVHAGGGGRLVAVAVADLDGRPLSPCGRCRQLLHEVGGSELLVNELRIAEWLPGAFGPEDLE